MRDMIEVSDKRVAISLLMSSRGEKYWFKTVKERLAMVKIIVSWLKQRLPHFC